MNLRVAVCWNLKERGGQEPQSRGSLIPWSREGTVVVPVVYSQYVPDPAY